MVEPHRPPRRDRQPRRTNGALEVRDPDRHGQARERRPRRRVATAAPPAPGPGPFEFVQLEFGWQLGPPDGRYLVRSATLESSRAAGETTLGEAGPLDAILVLRTLGAPERRRLRGRRGRSVSELEPAPVPTTRATVVRPEPFPGGAGEAARWLAAMRSDRAAAHAAVDAAVAILNRALQAYRVAAADECVTPVSPERALVVRLGFGAGEAVAGGEATRAWELPPTGRRRRVRSMEAPDERFAAILGGRMQVLACEELVLRAATDLRAGRTREAALEARVALEALLAELPKDAGTLADTRAVVADAANRALAGALPDPLVDRLHDAIRSMERLLRNRRLTT